MARKRPKWAKKGSRWDPAKDWRGLERAAKKYIERKRQAGGGGVPKWATDKRGDKRIYTQGRNVNKRKRIWAHAKLAEGCRICGWRDHAAGLDWHHVGEKKYSATRWPSLSWETALEEAIKCVVLCACCHRLVTQRGWDVLGSSKTSGIPNSGGREEIEQTENLG